MKKFCIPAALLLAVVLTPACYTFEHKVGNGGSGGELVEDGQWYVLWGLVPINKTDAKQMAGDATDYTVKTEFSVLDIIITAVTGFITVHKQTVTVQK